MHRSLVRVKACRLAILSSMVSPGPGPRSQRPSGTRITFLPRTLQPIPQPVSRSSSKTAPPRGPEPDRGLPYIEMAKRGHHHHPCSLNHLRGNSVSSFVEEKTRARSADQQGAVHTDAHGIVPECARGGESEDKGAQSPIPRASDRSKRLPCLWGFSPQPFPPILYPAPSFTRRSQTTGCREIGRPDRQAVRKL